jgi:hypothetical protein
VQACLAHTSAEAGDAFQARQVLDQALRSRPGVPFARRIQALALAATAFARLGLGVEAARVATEAVRLAHPRGLHLFVLDALLVLAVQEPDARARDRAREEARVLAASLHDALPADLAAAFRGRPGTAALLAPGGSG